MYQVSSSLKNSSRSNFDIQVTELHEEKNKERTNVKFQKCFYGSAILPANIEKVFQSLQEAKTWEKMYRVVNLRFSSQDFKQGIVGQAQADGEEDKADFQVHEIDLTNKIIKAHLINADKNNKTFLKKVEIEYKFTSVGSDTRFEITMLFDKREQGVMKTLFMKSVNVDNIVQQAIKQALKRLGRKVSNPESFNIDTVIEESIQPIPGELLAGYQYGNMGNYIIPAAQEDVYAIIENFKIYSEIHERFEYNNKCSGKTNIIKLRTIEDTNSSIMLNIEETIKNQKIALKSASSVAMIKDLQLVFELKPIEDKKTLCIMKFLYSYWPFTQGASELLTSGGINKSIRPLTENMIRTSLRHLSELILNPKPILQNIAKPYIEPETTEETVYQLKQLALI